LCEREIVWWCVRLEVKEKLMSSKYQKVESSESQDEISEEQQSIMAHVSNIPSTHSSQHLVNADAESVLTEEDAKSLSRRTRQTESSLSTVTKTQWFTVAVLCFINLINYMDRFTIAGEFLIQGNVGALS
jgi:valyl-tRNA synthetase